MRVFVAGKDRTADLGQDVMRAARELGERDDALEFLLTGNSALFLRMASDRSDYLRKLLELLVGKSGVSTADFYIPRRTGWRGAVSVWLKQTLWRLLRYQHERLVFQQNMINLRAAAALEFMREEYLAEIATLKHRVAQLEKARSRAGTPAQEQEKEP